MFEPLFKRQAPRGEGPVKFLICSARGEARAASTYLCFLASTSLAAA